MWIEDWLLSTHSFPGQSSPPLNSSLNVYWLPLVRVCALICVRVNVCVCTHWDECMLWEWRLNSSLISLSLFFYLILLPILNMNSGELLWRRVLSACVRLLRACVRAPPTVLQQCMSPSGVTLRHFTPTDWSLLAEERDCTCKNKKRKRTEREDSTSAISRELELEKKKRCCHIFGFLYPVFTWICFYSPVRVSHSSNPSLSHSLCIWCLKMFNIERTQRTLHI